MNNKSTYQIECNIEMYYLGIPVQLSKKLNDFRQKFDPKYNVNEPHATLVSPFSANIMTPELDQYIAQTIVQFKQQIITASGFYITPQGYVFYTFDQSSAELLQALYDRLHQHAALAQHKEKGHPFLPHITIGKFESEHDVPQSVREILPDICVRQDMLFDRVRLYGILDEAKKRVHVKDWLLS